MKAGLIGVFAAFVMTILVPASAWGWKAVAYGGQSSCIVDCGGNAYVPLGAPAVMCGVAAFVAILYWMGRLQKYETISMTCRRCGRPTRGLKCPFH